MIEEMLVEAEAEILSIVILVQVVLVINDHEVEVHQHVHHVLTIIPMEVITNVLEQIMLVLHM